MLEKLKALKDKLNTKIKGFTKLSGKQNSVSKNANRSKTIFEGQVVTFGVIGIVILMAIWSASSYLGKKDITSLDTKDSIDLSKQTIDLADKSLDTEKHWRTHFDDKLKKSQKTTSKEISEIKENQQRLLSEVQKTLSVAISQIQKTRREQDEDLQRSKREIGELLAQQQEIITNGSNVMPVEIGETEFSNELVFDEPKPSSEYIPEGTFLSGNLLAGIVASTAMSAPENPTPVVIKLTGRGDLDKRIWKKTKQCRIIGSSYGESNSERVTIRLERLTCKVGSNWVHTDIFGFVAGFDGKPGVKGTVVSLGQKHLKNAALGGFISGLSSAAKGEQGLAVTSGGLLATKSQTGMGILKQSGLQGVSNAADKVSDYYLKRADSLSDVLEVPVGAKVNPMIMKGVYFGQVKTRKAVERVRQEQMNSQRMSSQ